MQRQESLISRVKRKTYPEMSQNQSQIASSIVVMHYVLETSEERTKGAVIGSLLLSRKVFIGFN